MRKENNNNIWKRKKERRKYKNENLSEVNEEILKS